MGVFSSRSVTDDKFVGASSGSAIGPDGQVQVYHDTFSGTGQNGQYSGNGYSYHNVYPAVVSVISVLAIIIVIVCVLQVALGFRRTRAEANKKNNSPNKLALRARENPKFSDLEMKLFDNHCDAV